MTADEARAAISALASAANNNIRFASHAREQMSRRSITFHDVKNVLVNSTSCEPSTDGRGRWVVGGVDLDGEPTRAVVVIENGVLVITVF